MSERTQNILLSASALLVGGLLYLLFRENSYIGRFFGNIPLMATLRTLAAPFRCDAVCYYLPDLLWGFSLSCCIYAILLPKGSMRFFAASSGFICGTVWEGLQYGHLIGGTGDLLDVGMYLLGSGLCMLTNLKRRE